MRQVRYPINSGILSEARLYAVESLNHTMDYDGWKDQHKKLPRLTYGKFAQLWVTEFCRINDIEHKKDTSSPYVPDDMDLSICGYTIDVKATVNTNFLGQLSPGAINKPCDYLCFVVTDASCSFVEPFGFMAFEDYKAHAIRVEQGQLIPGTNIAQRFGSSFFLPKPLSALPIIPFVKFILSKRADSERRAKLRVVSGGGAA